MLILRNTVVFLAHGNDKEDGGDKVTAGGDVVSDGITLRSCEEDVFCEKSFNDAECCCQDCH